MKSKQQLNNVVVDNNIQHSFSRGKGEDEKPEARTAIKKNRRVGEKKTARTKILISNKFEQNPRWGAELLFRNDVIGQSHKISNSPSATDFECLVYTHSDTQQLITTDRP
jgi:hypothetical protein